MFILFSDDPASRREGGNCLMWLSSTSFIYCGHQLPILNPWFLSPFLPYFGLPGAGVLFEHQLQFRSLRLGFL